MYSIERDFMYLVEIEVNNLEEAKKIADENMCDLYKDNELIYKPIRKRSVKNV
jgi:hypothetical protein